MYGGIKANSYQQKGPKNFLLLGELIIFPIYGVKWRYASSYMNNCAHI